MTRVGVVSSRPGRDPEFLTIFMNPRNWLYNVVYVYKSNDKPSIF